MPSSVVGALSRMQCLEQPDRSALAHHVHRNAQLGLSVLINETWYKLRPGDIVVMDNLLSHKISGVREAIGRHHVGDVSQHAWGVMDVLVNTDFPD